MKTCTKCKETKSLDEFPNEAKRKDGKYPWCKICLSDHRKKRYKSVPRKVWITQKVCSKCKQWKPRDEFRFYSNGNIHYRCIVCEDFEKDLDEKGLCDCSSCGKIKPLNEFYKSRQNKTSRQCIDCHKSYHSSTEGYERRREYSLRKLYGITLNQYKELLDKQNYRCPICLEEFEMNNFSYPVDHAHGGSNAGVIRGIVHDFCNRFVIGKHNDPEQLRRAADLIENPITDWFVPEAFIKGPKRKRKRKMKAAGLIA